MRITILFITLLMSLYFNSEVSAQYIPGYSQYRQVKGTVDYYKKKDKNQTNRESEKKKRKTEVGVNNNSKNENYNDKEVEEINDNTTYSTTENRLFDYVKDRKQSIYILLLNSLRDIKEYKNFRIAERYDNELPKLITFEIVMGYHFGSEWSGIEKVKVGLIINEELPIALYLTENTNIKYCKFPYKSLHGWDYHKIEFSEIQKSKIDKLYVQFKNELLMNNTSYQAVLAKHNSYPKEYNMKNCIGIVLKKENAVRMNWVDNPDYGSVPGAMEKNPNLDFDGSMMVKYYKNISNHPIVIKGIYKKATQNGYVYLDESIILQPGQTTDYFNFTETFDDDSRYNVQYLGNPGIIKTYK